MQPMRFWCDMVHRRHHWNSCWNHWNHYWHIHSHFLTRDSLPLTSLYITHFNGAIIIFSIFSWTCKLLKKIPFLALDKTLVCQSIVFEIRCAVWKCVLDAFANTHTHTYYIHIVLVFLFITPHPPFMPFYFLNSSSHLSQFYLI